MDYPIRLPSQLGEHLRSLRKAKGLTQIELGRRIGVGQARMGEIERNTGSVSLDQLLVILGALDASLLLHTAANEEKAQHLSTEKPKKLARTKEPKKPLPDSSAPTRIKIPSRKGSW